MTPVVEPVARLIEALSRLPGIGPRTAQRLTYHLLRTSDGEARTLAAALVAVRDEVVSCDLCFNISTGPRCPICLDTERDDARLCVVEEPLDVLALERSGAYRGRYHVLQGAISPMDGIGPDRLRIRELLAASRSASRGRALRRGRPRHQPDPRGGGDRDVPRRAADGSRRDAVTRIARGIPVGGDLEYADEVTLVRALQGRRELDVDREPVPGR